VNRILYTLLCAAALVTAADKDFNGRWDITVPDNDRARAWWLEIKNAESGKPTGSFISAYSGDLNPINEASVKDGELHVIIRSKSQTNPGSTHLRARLVNGRLEGTRELADGQKGPTLKFIGVRAPKFKTVDASKLKAGTPIELFNGRDLSGWRTTRPGAKLEWSVENGITSNKAGASDIATDQKFWNFKLHAEYRVEAKSNSGIGLRGRYEIQILEDHGRTPDTHSHGSLYSRVAPTRNASKPAGEWQTMDITLVENRVTVVLNGAKIIENAEIDGLTAMAANADEGNPGPIMLQGDHGKVEFRKLTLTPLT
jgi:hypothetical protein